jgi:hypothetical protein
MPAALRRVTLGVLLTVLIVLVGCVAAGAQTATTTPPAATTSPAGAAARSTTVATPGDTQSSRTVNRIVLALLALGGLLAVLTFWLWRTTKPKPNHLDGLDSMGTRRWRAASSERRAALLAPVHERRGDIRDEDLIAAPETNGDEAPAAVGPEADEPAAQVADEPAAPVAEEPAEAVAQPAEPAAPAELAAPAAPVAPADVPPPAAELPPPPLASR